MTAARTTLHRRRAGARLALAALLLASSACADYGRHRLLDVTDILDTKWSCSLDSLAFGAKVEVTDYFGVGAGIGYTTDVKESYGRWERTYDQDFAQFVAFGLDGPPFTDGVQPGTSVNTLGFNCCQDPRPPMIDRWRIGAEVLVFNIDAGLYVNLGEIYDLVVGLATFDPATDDHRYWDAPLDLTEWSED